MRLGAKWFRRQAVTPDHSKRHDAMNGLDDSTRSADTITRHDPFTEWAQEEEAQDFAAAPCLFNLMSHTDL
jgi:hypothetical protein